MPNLRIEQPANRSLHAVAGKRPSDRPTSAEADRRELNSIAQMQTRLQQMLDQSAGLGDLVKGCVAMQTQRDNIAGCLLLRREDGGEFSIETQVIKNDSVNVPAIAKELAPHLSQTLASGVPMIGTSDTLPLEFVLMPLDGIDACVMVTLARSPLSIKQRSLELAIGQLQSLFLKEANSRERLVIANRETTTTAAVLELVAKTQQQSTTRAACQQIASTLKLHLKCDQVIVGTTSNGKTCRVDAISDLAWIDHQSESTIQIKAVLDECAGRKSTGSWPPLPGIRPHQLLAHKQLAGRDSLVLSAPLTNQDDEIVGAIAVVARRQMPGLANFQHQLSAMGQPLGSTLENVRRNQKGILGRSLAALTTQRHRMRLVAAVAFVAFLMGAMFLPWTYTISCQSVIEPVTRQFCVSPHDGLLESTLAEPGEVVHAGQLLAKMDGREIRWELAGVMAEKNRVAKQRDSHLANQETAQALMADLELKRLHNKETLLQFRESRLSMVSPSDGIVLSGSLDRRENYPVSKGQVLYEVAPLDEVRIEVAIAAEEVLHVKTGDVVDVQMEGFDGESVQGTIDRIHPRAEIRENDNVFVADVTIPNNDGQLRPGMKGTAKIRTTQRSIGWITFHHAAEHFRAAVPW